MYTTRATRGLGLRNMTSVRLWDVGVCVLGMEREREREMGVCEILFFFFFPFLDIVASKQRDCGNCMLWFYF